MSNSKQHTPFNRQAMFRIDCTFTDVPTNLTEHPDLEVQGSLLDYHVLQQQLNTWCPQLNSSQFLHELDRQLKLSAKLEHEASMSMTNLCSENNRDKHLSLLPISKSSICQHTNTSNTMEII